MNSLFRFERRRAQQRRRVQARRGRRRSRVKPAAATVNAGWPLKATRKGAGLAEALPEVGDPSAGAAEVLRKGPGVQNGRSSNG